MALYSYLRAAANAPFTSGVQVSLTDIGTFSPIVLPAGAILTKIFIEGGDTPFSSDGVLNIGWSGAPEALLPSSVGISALGLNSAAVLYRPLPVSTATTESHTVLARFNFAGLPMVPATINTGQVNVVIEYILFENLPASS